MEQEAPVDHGPPANLSTVIHQVIQKSYEELRSLRDKLVTKSSDDRKIELTKYFKKTRVQFYRLLFLMRWSNQIDTIETAKRAIELLHEQNSYFSLTPDTLHDIQHNQLENQKIPAFDLRSAIDVTVAGTFPRLPMSISRPHEILQLPAPKVAIAPGEEIQLKERLNTVIQDRLLSLRLPSSLHIAKIDDGKLYLVAKDEFQASVTLLDGFEPNDPWTVISLDLFVAPEGQTNYVGWEASMSLRAAVQEVMNKSRSPLVELYSVTHLFCLSLQLDILKNQADSLNKLKNSFNITNLSYERDTLTLHYWRAPQNDAPYLRISIMRYQTPETTRHELKVSHYPALYDPETKQAANISISSSAVNLQRLLTTIRELNTYSILSDLTDKIKSLSSALPNGCKSPRLYSAKNFECPYVEIGLYDGYTACIKVDQLTGRLCLRDFVGLSEAQAKSLDDKLNDLSDGSLKHVVTTLYSKSVLYAFKQIARSLGYEPNQTIHGQTSEALVSLGQHVLYMSFLDNVLDHSYVAVSVSPELRTRFFVFSVKTEGDSLAVSFIYEVTASPSGECTFIPRDPKLPLPDEQQLPRGGRSNSVASSKQASNAGSVYNSMPSTPTASGLSNSGVIASPSTKRRKLDEDHADMKELLAGRRNDDPAPETAPKTESPIMDSYVLLCTVMDSCKEQLWCYTLIHQFEELNITVSPHHDTEYISSLNMTEVSPVRKFLLDIHQSCDPLSINRAILAVHPGYGYQVILEEGQTSFSLNCPIVAEKSPAKSIGDSRSLSYLADQKQWVFEYGKVSQASVSQFVSDLKGVRTIVDLVQQYLQTIEDPINDAMLDFFEIESFSPHRLVIRYAKNVSELRYSMLMVWRETEISTFFLPHEHPLARFASMELSLRRDLVVLLKMLNNSHIVVEELIDYIHRQGIRAVDCTVVPIDISRIRVYVRRDACVEIRFLGNNFISVDVVDMSRMGVTQSSHVLLPLPHFMTFSNSVLHKTVQSLMMKESADANSMIPGALDKPAYKYSVARKSVVLHEALFPDFLAGLYPYMASISMLSWIAKQRQTLYLNTIPPERRSTPPAPEGLASDQDADHYLEYTGLYTYKDRPDDRGLRAGVYLDPTSWKLNLQVVLSNDMARIPTTLMQFFAKRVAQIPYRSSVLSWLISLLAWPIEVVNEILQVYEYEERVGDAEAKLELCLVPERANMKSIIATDGHERYTFVIILSGSGEQHIAGLVYNTKSFKLGAWNDHLKDKDGNPLPTTASLLEASQVSQALGSLSYSVSQLYNYWSTTELPKRLALRAKRN